MTVRSTFIAISMLCAISLPARAQVADVTAVTTADIVAATTAAAGDLACLDFRINGLCLFLVCSPFGCSIDTSIQFRHFNPSLVVTAYNALGESPWSEIQALFGTAQVTANNAQFAALGVNPLSIPGGGKFADRQVDADRSDEIRKTSKKHLVFKDAEVIGAPGNALSLAGSLGLPISCPTTDVAPLFPYFLSGLDAFAWRSGLTEIIFPETFIPGLREIGDFPLNTWGSVHPRSGFINTPEDPKAGAVVAQRAADIATREDQPHVYVPVGSVDGFASTNLLVFEPDPVVENDPDNAKWQFLVPVTETDCIVFGENDTADIATGFSSNRVSQAGDYAWALWRPYRCCEQNGAFLTEIEFSDE